MDESKLLEILKTSGIPFCYHAWKDPPPPPYGVYLLVSESKFYADGILYHQVSRYQIELYTKKKSPSSEKKVEGALTGAGISYRKSEVYLESEKLFEILYECEV